MTGFVFKIQANMDPNHRDRIAFVRVCSGKLERGMKAKLVRTGKPMSLSAPQFFFARTRVDRRRGLCRRRGRHSQPRHAAHRRHADRGRGHPVPRRAELRAGNPAPRAARRRDEGQEAARRRCSRWRRRASCSSSRRDDGSPAIVGVVGALQLDVLKERLSAEYTLPVDFEMSRFSICRWISADDKAEVLALRRGRIAATSPAISTAIRCSSPSTPSR